MSNVRVTLVVLNPMGEMNVCIQASIHPALLVLHDIAILI